jgi:signal transduction histidine kinase/CheY-like chemotaxis protein
MKSTEYLKKTGDTGAVGNIYNNMGLVFTYLKDYDKALEYHKKALSIWEENQDQNGIATTYSNIAYVYKNQNKFDLALKNYQTSLKIVESLTNKHLMAIIYISTGQICTAQKRYSSALEHLEKGLGIAIQYGMAHWEKEAYFSLSEMYEKMGSYKKSLECYKLFKSSQDSILNTANQRILNELQTKFEIEKNTKELIYSKNENLLLQKDISFKDLMIKQSQFFTVILCFIIIIILLVSFFLYKRNQYKQRLNTNLETLVADRTLELQQSNLSLQAEIKEKIDGEKKLKEAKEKAEESDRLKSAFLANMSHEIRTPMNVIVGFSDMIDRDLYNPNKIKYYTKLIKDGTRQLLSVINDILDIAQLDAGILELYENEFDLNALLNDVYHYFKNQLIQTEKTQIQLYLNKGLRDDLCRIKLDDTRLRQILTNLIGNAIKFTEKGFVEVGYTVEHETQLLFYIKDTGIGITKEKQEVIFERFIQLEESATRTYGGTGIGLSISKGLIKLIGGDIWVESEINKGSTFYFSLPYRSAISQFEVISLSNVNYIWRDITILIIQDDENSQTFFEKALASTKAQLIFAQNGLSGIEKFRSNFQINIVLIDIQLKGFSSFETVRLIKQIKKIPVIGITSYEVREEKELLLQNGFDEIITKPLNKEGLLESIKKYLN